MEDEPIDAATLSYCRVSKSVFCTLELQSPEHRLFLFCMQILQTQSVCKSVDINLHLLWKRGYGLQQSGEAPHIMLSKLLHAMPHIVCLCTNLAWHWDACCAQKNPSWALVADIAITAIGNAWSLQNNTRWIRCRTSVDNDHRSDQQPDEQSDAVKFLVVISITYEARPHHHYVWTHI